MKYLEWNNLIAGYLFNSQNAGRDVHIYITKTDLINAGRTKMVENSDLEIWQDFIAKIKTGIPGSSQHPDIISKAVFAYEQSKRPGIRVIEGIELSFPPYLAYLTFIVLPLIEVQGDYNANNYYDRLEQFLKDNNINQNLRNKLKEIEPLWADLVGWVNDRNNGELGYFALKRFIHQNWVYVGKVFSQCVLPPRSLKKIPEAFLEAGMLPGSVYSLNEFKRLLLDYGNAILMLPASIIEIIKKSENNELGQSIIDTIKREYEKWTGESHSRIQSAGVEIIKKNYTPCRLYLQIDPKANSHSIRFSYRMYSTNDFPSDLKFGDIENIYENRGWSKTLNLEFRESFELKDDLNKWVAKFPAKDIRLFINAGYLQFSSSYWLEVDTLSRNGWMYLLCNNKYRDTVSLWAQESCQEFTDLSDFENMPAGYSLFKIFNPGKSHSTLTILTVHTHKSIQLTGGLRVNFRTFLSDYLPDVHLSNAIGNEVLYIQYKHSQEKGLLKKKELYDIWELPVDILLNHDFCIKIENEVLSGFELTYKVISANDTAVKLDNTQLPKRDPFGKIMQGDADRYCVGSNTIGASLKRQLAYSHLFKSVNEDRHAGIITPAYNHHAGNTLLSFLTLKQNSTTEDFYRVFETLHMHHFKNRLQNTSINYSKIKKASLNFFDYLGYLDYDYESKSIVVNPPQLIYIPSTKGRKCLLIGGRDAAFVNKFIELACKFDLQVEITPQFAENEILLLPDAITVKSFYTPEDRLGEKKLSGFAAELNIAFSTDNLIQLNLQDFSASIEEYLQNMLQKDVKLLEEYDWGRKVFNVENLLYEWAPDNTVDKKYALLEYKLNEYTFYNRMWIDGQLYSVDKNWGKYLALKNSGKQIILYDEQKLKVAIPLELPLPRLLAEALMLLSGLAPSFRTIEGRSYRLYENIPSIFIQNLFNRLSQKTKQFNF